MSTIAERLLILRGKAKQGDFAKTLGVNPNTLRSYENGRSNPNQEFLERLCVQFSVSPSWLLLGIGPMRANEPTEQPTPPAPVEASPVILKQDVRASRTAPVIGLASCGIAGWYNPAPIALRAPIPDTYTPKGEVIAVIAIGKSMQPDGIRQGYVAICDTGVQPVVDDAVFVERVDGHSSIKRYVTHDAQWLHLQGWLDPDERGEQRPYNEQLLLEAVKRIVPVVIVCRRA